MTAEKEHPIYPVSPQTNTSLDQSLEGRPAENHSGSDDEIVGEEALDHEEDAEDCAPRTVAVDPGLPTEKELEEHKADHLPYRSWCKECVESKAPAEAHRKGIGKRRKIPVIAFDYLDLHKDMQRIDGTAVASEASASRIKVRIVKDPGAQFAFAHVVPQKGIDEKRFAVDCLVEDTRHLGYNHIAMKSDQEPAIKKLMSEAIKSIKVQADDLIQVVPENSPGYDPQSNGLAEAAVKSVTAHARTLYLGLQTRIGKLIPLEHPVVAWLLRHAAFLLAIRKRGNDGCTPYERLKGRGFNNRLLEFGELASFKTKGAKGRAPISERSDTFKPRWNVGVFIGFNMDDGTYQYVGTQGYGTARCAKRMPTRTRWAQ